jgi:hypothetical protein
MNSSWAQLVSRCTYIPDSEIEVVEGEHIGQISLGSQIRLKMLVQNTYDPGNPQKTIIQHVGGLPDFGITGFDLDTDMGLRYIQRFIRGVAQHESDEWFRVDGKIYDDPHKRR